MLLLPADVQRAAIEMCPSILQLKAGHTPVTIASTALLFALRLHHSQPPSIEGSSSYLSKFLHFFNFSSQTMSISHRALVLCRLGLSDQGRP
jgi:hypothetical protein